MSRHFYEKVFSTSRMQKYFDRYPSAEHLAIQHYHQNIELSESFYPLLSLFEVALRNSLNRELVRYFGRNDWYLCISTSPGLSKLNRPISTAKHQISKRHEGLTADKVTAELTLGFWVRLLNVEYERILWKPLRRAFPSLPKEKRQRKNVSAPINQIRDFRNRVFHHEPVSWNLERVQELHARMLKVLSWLNEDLPKIAASLDRVPTVLSKIRTERK